MKAKLNGGIFGGINKTNIYKYYINQLSIASSRIPLSHLRRPFRKNGAFFILISRLVAKSLTLLNGGIFLKAWA